MAVYIIGLDIGGTKTAVVLGTPEGEILRRESFPTGCGFEGTFERLCAATERALREAGPDVAAISVSIGGPLDVLRGVIYSPPNLPGWDDIPLKDLLSERFGLPVYIEHDGNAGTLAEFFFGAGRGFRNIVFITMGTGFGAGLILDGKLYRGTNYLAGEVGHWRISTRGPEAYGKRGSWEAFCSGPGLERLARYRFPERWGEGVSAREITELAHAGDPDALDVVRTCGRYLGRGLALIVDLLNPEKILIGSMAVRLGELLLEPARRVVRREALAQAAEACEITTPALGERIGDVASLCAALDQGKLIHYRSQI